jgi:hypothetical protein
MTSDEEIDDTQGFLSFISTSEVLWAAIVFCQIGGVYATEISVMVKDMLNNGSEHRWVELTDFWAFYGLSV